MRDKRAGTRLERGEIRADQRPVASGEPLPQSYRHRFDAMVETKGKENFDRFDPIGRVAIREQSPAGQQHIGRSDSVLRLDRGHGVLESSGDAGTLE